MPMLEDEKKISMKDLKEVADIFAGILGPKIEKTAAPSPAKPEASASGGGLLGPAKKPSSAGAGQARDVTDIGTIAAMFEQLEEETEALLGAGGQYGPPEGEGGPSVRKKTVNEEAGQGVFKKMIRVGNHNMGTGDENAPKITDRPGMYNDALQKSFDQINNSDEMKSASIWETVGTLAMTLSAAAGIPAGLIAGMGMHKYGSEKKDRLWEPFKKETDASMKKLYGDDDGDAYGKKWAEDNAEKILAREGFQIERQKAVLRDSSPLMTLVRQGIEDGVSVSTMASRAIAKGNIDIGDLLLSADVEGVINDIIRELKKEQGEAANASSSGSGGIQKSLQGLSSYLAPVTDEEKAKAKEKNKQIHEGIGKALKKGLKGEGTNVGVNLKRYR